MHFNKWKKSKFLYIVIIITFILIYFLSRFILNKIQQINNINKDNIRFQKIKKEEKQYTKSFNLVQKLAYLGLNKFMEGLGQEGNNDYKQIFQGDPELFIQHVLEGNLKTVSTPLIYGTINFVSEIFKKNIRLSVNNNAVLFTNNPSMSLNEVDILNIKILNRCNIHFYIQTPEDTPSDGYCFFHALNTALQKEAPEWTNKINRFIESNSLKEINTFI
ncbi:hypothetical protein ['Camptotheca acuminata' phytoplasma]|uniref:hypothetical protein n=1 Tax='Camptotheca acuminata' phytoplasma TaxID=3239192 RepID=UPI003519E256